MRTEVERRIGRGLLNKAPHIAIYVRERASLRPIQYYEKRCKDDSNNAGPRSR